MSRRMRALLLTVLLPGLGQLSLGRTARGIALILLTNLLLLLTLGVLVKAAAPLLAARFSSGAPSTDQVHAALEQVTPYGRALLGAFALLWGIAAADILRGNAAAGQR